MPSRGSTSRDAGAQLAAGVLQRPDRAEPQDPVDEPDRVVEGLARPELRRPDRRCPRDERDRLLLRGGRSRVARPHRAAAERGADIPRARRPSLLLVIVARQAHTLAARDAVARGPPAPLGADPLGLGADVRGPLAPVPRRSACCSSRSARSSRSSRRSSSAASASPASTRPAMRRERSCCCVVTLGTTLALLGLGLVQAATASALVEIDAGPADRAARGLPRRPAQAPAAVRRHPHRRARGRASGHDDRADPGGDLARGPLAPARPGRRAGGRQGGRRPAAELGARARPLAPGRLARRGKCTDRARPRPVPGRAPDRAHERTARADERRRRAWSTR